MSIFAQICGDIANHNLLIQNLITIGTVCEVDYEHKKVKVATLNNKQDEPQATTRSTRWVTGSGANHLEWNPPKVGDICVVLNPGGDYGQSFVLPYLFTGEEENLPTDADTYLKKFSDGSSMKVNTEDKEMTFKAAEGGTFTIKTDTGETKITVTEDGLVMESNDQVQLKRGGNTVTLGNNIVLTSAANLNLIAQTINMTAPTISVTGVMNVTGNLTLNGQQVLTA